MMRKLRKHIICGGFALCLLSCSSYVPPKNVQQEECLPSIWPDYIEVTIPAGIAPLNFNAADSAVDAVYVTAKGSKKGEIEASGTWADFDIKEWHQLTEENKGGEISLTVSMRKDGEWKQYKAFSIFVSPYDLDDYGLTYRRIPPGYEVGGNIGMYQRDIHSFEESPLLQETAVPGQCMNCHTANRTQPQQFYLHVRGDKGGTLIQQNNRRTWLNTKTDSTISSCAHGYWHPQGRYIAFSLSPVAQSFYVGKERFIEPYDLASDLLVLDVQTNELIRSPLLETEHYETFPAFSSTGDKIYFSTSRHYSVPAEVSKIRYSICQIDFDATTGTIGSRIDTLLHADTYNKSFTFVRPSYDGKYLMLCQMDYGMFPVDHPESDLALYDLRTKSYRVLDEVNSKEAESFHNWSSNSHWFVFTSRREDGMYTQLYIAGIDDKGKAGKPFLLPQRNPKEYYQEMFDAYNTPDFTHTKVEFDVRNISSEILSGKRVPVQIRADVKIKH